LLLKTSFVHLSGDNRPMQPSASPTIATVWDASNFMTSIDQFFQVCDVIFAPIDLPPILFVPPPRFMCWFSIGNQEKCGGYAVTVENGNGIVELAPKPIVESERNNWSHD
jgi:hypothetical protein